MANYGNYQDDKNTRAYFVGSSLLYGNQGVPVNKKLFLKMKAFEWTRNPSRVVKDELLLGNSQVLSDIRVPIPKDIEFGTNMQFVDDKNIIETSKTVSDLVGKLETIDNIFAYVAPDRTDNLFLRQEKRKFNLKFTLVAMNRIEAQEIIKISNQLVSLSLPQRDLSGSRLRQKYSFAPPLWLFGIGLGLDSKIEPTWLGQSSFCVCQSVSVNPAAGGFPYTIEVGNDTMPLPLITSISINFMEYQAAYREEGEPFVIVNRSQI